MFLENEQVEMERRDFDSKIRGGLVRAAINQYGDGKGDGISWKKSLPQDSSEVCILRDCKFSFNWALLT